MLFKLRVTRTLVVPFFSVQKTEAELPFVADTDVAALNVAMRFSVRMPNVITTVGIEEINEEGRLVRVVEPDRLVP